MSELDEKEAEEYMDYASMGFNTWFYMLPYDDFSLDYDNATPVYWSVETGEWL